MYLQNIPVEEMNEVALKQALSHCLTGLNGEGKIPLKQIQFIVNKELGVRFHSKTIYLHDNGEFVIWGRSEYFESSDLVVKHWSLDEEVMDSDTFREIIRITNDYRKRTKKLLKEKNEYIKECEKELEKSKDVIMNIKHYSRQCGFWGKNKKVIKYVIDNLK